MTPQNGVSICFLMETWNADVEILGFEALAGRRTIQSIQTLTDLKSETGLYGLSGILVMCFHSCQWVDFYR